MTERDADNLLRTVFHDDGTVTIWDMYQQRWVERARFVGADVLASLSVPERYKVRAHLRPELNPVGYDPDKLRVSKQACDARRKARLAGRVVANGGAAVSRRAPASSAKGKKSLEE